MTDTQEGGSKHSKGNPARTVGVVVIVILIGAALAYYAYTLVTPGPTPINEILTNIRDHDGTGVVVRGKVSAPTNLVYKWYDLTDDTGTIKVITERGLPKEGEEITVKGIVSEVFSMPGIGNLTVIIESVEPD